MNLKSFFRIFTMIALLMWVPFALAMAFLLSFTTGMEFTNLLYSGIWGGLVFGVIFGIGIAFLLQVITITRHVKDRSFFVTQVNTIMARIGYRPISRFGDLFTYQPTFYAGILAGDISIQIDRDSAIIIGPCVYIRKINKMMNLIIPD